MSMLKKAIQSSLGDHVRFIEGYQFPGSVYYCEVPTEKFAEAAKAMKDEYVLLAAEWATDETLLGRGYGIFACYRWGSEYLIVKSGVPADDPAFPSLTKVFLPAYRFERQMQSLMGVRPKNHPDQRPWIKFEDWPEDAWPLRKSFDASRSLPRVAGEYPWRARLRPTRYRSSGSSRSSAGHFRSGGREVINLERSDMCMRN
jgi:Ni,Fe-hydrogenase III component G